MKKRIIQLFHNRIGKKEKREPDKGGTAVEIDSLNGDSEGKMLNAAVESGIHADINLQNVLDKVAEQREFYRVVDATIRDGHGRGCILISDLDRFREINDLYGRATGDAVLRNVAGVLYTHFEGCACIARTGGDIFALWIPDMSGEEAEAVRRQVGMANDRLLHPQKELPPVSISVGAAFYEEGDDCRSLGKKANKMLYVVKESGRCGCEIYDGSRVS